MASEKKGWSQQEIDYLVTNYTSSEEVRVIARKLNRSLYSVMGKAQLLKLSRPRHQWSREELDLLEAWAETKDFPTLVKDWNRKARRLGWSERTTSALSNMIHKQGLTRTPCHGCYRASSLARSLGVSEETMMWWIRHGWLKAIKQNDDQEKRSPYLIFDKDVVNFALNHPATVAQKVKEDGIRWLLQLISETK